MAARGVIFRMNGPDERADQHDHADDEGPRQPGLPGPQRILGGQENGQHDHEHNDEHVRNAGPIRQGRDVGPVLPASQSAGQEGVIDISGEHRDAQRGQHGAQHIGGRHLHDKDQQGGQGQHIDQDVEAETEEGVGLALGPQREFQATVSG